MNDSFQRAMSIHTFEFEKSSDFRPLITEYWTTSFVFALIYLIFLFVGQRFMKDRKAFNLRLPLTIWSFTLAIFSILGAVRTWKYLGALLMWGGLKTSLCYSGFLDTYTIRFWSMLFVLSKLVELGDTVFIILRKQKLLFLHWFHHSTVLVYTWFAYKYSGAGGYWFMTMNYGVHAFMYSYYTVRALGLKTPRILPMIITTLQITQMLIGATVSILSFMWRKDCASYASKQYLFWTFAIYFVYFALFLNFFYKAYFRSAEIKAKVKAKSQ